MQWPFRRVPFTLSVDEINFVDFTKQLVFLDIERSTEVLYDIRKLELFAVLFVYIDKEQLDKLEFDKGGYTYEKIDSISFSISLCVGIS